MSQHLLYVLEERIPRELQAYVRARFPAEEFDNDLYRVSVGPWDSNTGAVVAGSFESAGLDGEAVGHSKARS